MQIREEFNVIFICAVPLLALLCMGGWKTGRLNPQLNYLLSPCSLTDECSFEELLINMTALSPCLCTAVFLSFISSSMLSLSLCLLMIRMLFIYIS